MANEIEKLQEDLKNKQKAAETNLKINDENDLRFEDNNAADCLDRKLKEQSEAKYMEIASTIVNISGNQLDNQNKSKNTLKLTFTVFFICFISVQYIALIILLFSKAFCENMDLSDPIIITYITSVFVETLGAILIMVKYAFDSEQETNVLKILSEVISSYKKFNEKK